MLRQKSSCSTYFTMCWINVMEDKVMVLEGLQWQYLCVQSLSHFGWIYKQHHKYTPYYSLYLTVVWQCFRYQPHAENKDSIFKIFIWSGHSWGTWHPRVTEHLWDHCGHSGRGGRGVELEATSEKRDGWWKEEKVLSGTCGVARNHRTRRKDCMYVCACEGAFDVPDLWVY